MKVARKILFLGMDLPQEKPKSTRLTEIVVSLFLLLGVTCWCYQAYQPLKQAREILRADPNFETYRQQAREKHSFNLLDWYNFGD